MDVTPGVRSRVIIRKVLAAAAGVVVATGMASSASVAQTPPPADFRVGAATVDISPSKLVNLSRQRVCLGGYGIGCSRPATGEREPLYARALVVESLGQKVALVTSSNVGLFAKYKDSFGRVGTHDVRLAAAQATGIPSSNIVVTSDHSHSSPDVEGIWGGVDPAYLRKHATALVQAVYEANRSLEDADLYVGASTYGDVDPDPLKNHWDGTDGPLDQIDRELRVLQARRPGDGSVIATLVNFAPHASVLNEPELASGDWTGVLANRFADEHGGVAMAMVGALGGIGARASEDEFDDFVAFVDGLVDDALASAIRMPGVPGVQAARTFIREPVTAPLLYSTFSPVGAQDPANPLGASIDRAVTPPWSTGNLVGTYVSAIRIGALLIGGAPGEAYPEISFRFARDAHTYEHMLFGLADDQLGYLISPLEGVPTAAENGGLYPLMGNDNFGLSVSPTIGDHVACTLLNLAAEVGVHTAAPEPRCEALTATDGVAPPEEIP